MSGVAPGPTSGKGSSRSRVNRGNGLAGPRVAAGTVKAVRRTVAAEEGMETTASVQPLARGRREHVHLAMVGAPVSTRPRALTAPRVPQAATCPRSGPGADAGGGLGTAGLHL